MIKFDQNSPAICGSLHPATKEGFISLLREANDALVANYDLIGFERIEKKLAAIYKKRVPVQAQPVEIRSPLVDEFSG